MKAQHWMVALSSVNAAMLLYTIALPRPTAAQAPAAVIRARAIELIDENGRTRAELKIFPKDPNVKMPDGSKGYPETVLFRLITSNGRPTVKIAATEDGSVVSLGGDADPSHVQLLARGATTSIKLVNQDGKQQLVKP